MSAVLALFSFGAAKAPERALAARLLGSMRARGAGRVAIHCEEGVALAVARHDWELGTDFSGSALLAEEGPIVVAADASLYYREKLLRKLADAGVVPLGTAPAHLVLAAYRAWGTELADRLEGDYAFVVWDRERRQVVVARDFVGTRPLHVAELPGGLLVVASTVGAVSAHPDCPDDLALDEVGIDAGGLLYGVGDATCRRHVRRVPAGATLVASAGGPLRCVQRWEPRDDRPVDRRSFDEAAEELRELITAATRERLAREGRSTVWLSGGRDSSAVYATARAHLASRNAHESLVPVTGVLPSTDRACETAEIDAILAHWNDRARRIAVYDVPLLADPASAAAARDEPYAQEYEQFQRAMLRESRAAGARVALNGHGGDLLFFNTLVTLSDLLGTGRLLSFSQELWRHRSLGGRSLFKWGVEPALPSWTLAAVTAMRSGRPLQPMYGAGVPPWMRAGFAAEHGLAERVRMGPPRRRGRNGVAEMAWLLARPFLARVMSTSGGYGLSEGVEIRSPLLDRRVIEFALARPNSDRRRHGDTKRLVRHAMAPLLPASTLAPRRFKTGTMLGYFRHRFAEVAPHLRSLASGTKLAELGIIDEGAFRRLAERQLGGTANIRVGPAILASLHTELWLRAHSGDRDASIPPSAREPIPLSA